MAAAASAVLLVLLLSMSSGSSNLGGGMTLWRPVWGPRLARADDAGGAFLASQLPLKPLVTTPVQLLQPSSTAVTVTGRQALTVVYSRPVIALGADFGTDELFAGKVPFNVTCATSAVPPGKARWVTTTIARFDPEQDWPTDLDCSFIFNTDLTAFDGAKVQLPKTRSTRRLTSPPLSGYLSTVLSELAANASGGSWTPTLTSSSSGAASGTDGATPEVPSDGIVTLYYSYPVNRTLLAAALQLQPNPDNLKLNVSRCISPWPGATASTSEADAADDACVAITFSGALRDATQYELVLPTGSRYSLQAGLTSKALSQPLMGLRPFRLPIRQDFQMPADNVTSVWDGTRYRRLTLWLPRGLAKGTTAQDLAKQVTVCQLPGNGTTCNPVAITSAKLVPPSHLQVQVDALKPRTKYRAAVAASDAVKDAFGRTLQASSGDFWSLDVTPFFTYPSGASPVAHFSPAALPASWPVAAFGSDGSSLRAAVWALDASTDKGRLQLVSVASRNDLLLDTYLGAPASELQRGSPTNPATQLSLPLDASKDAQVFGTCCNALSYPTERNVSSFVQLVLRSSLLATWVLVPGQQVSVWVTGSGADNAGPVQGATAYLYYLQFEAVTTVVPLGSCTTDATGACNVPVPAPDALASLTLVGLVRGPGGKGGLVFTPNVGYWTTFTTSPYTSTLVLDKALARPGEDVRVTGYIAQKQAPASSNGLDGWRLGAPNNTKALLVVTPSWSGSGSPSVLEVPVSASYGSLHANLSVPSDAPAGVYSVYLYVSPTDQLPSTNGTGGSVSGGSGRRRMLHAASWRRELKQEADPAQKVVSGGSSSSSSSSSSSVDLSNLLQLASESVTVADPRPPTADLTLKVDPWARPTAAVKVSLQATSYLGSQVSNASINVVWNTYQAQGVVVATTDAKGAATAVIPLDTLPPANVSAPGSPLSISAEWIGPTRERIVRTASVRLDLTYRRLSISPTLQTNVPGLRWGVQASLTSNVDGSAIKGTKISVQLVPNTTAGAQCNTTLSCDVLSGDVASGAQCQLYLPCVGPFVLVACTNDTIDPSLVACTNSTLGLNSTQWAAAPYTRFDEPSLLPEKATFTIGEVARLWFQNAWSTDATAIALWGNQDSTPFKSKYLGKLEIGPVKVELPLGAECAGGCSVAVLLSVPKGVGELDPLPGFVYSKLFDPLGAHTHALITDLNIAQPDGLAVSIAVASNSTSPATTTVVNGATLPVLAPGERSTVSVQVADGGKPAGDAEVTLLAVDKAMLDLLPYALKELTPALALQLINTPSATEVDGTLVAPGALPLVFQTLARRLGLDPWLPQDTNIVPAVSTNWWSSAPFLSAVDLTDEQYLDQYTTSITAGPGRSVSYSSDGSGGCGRGGGEAQAFLCTAVGGSPASPAMSNENDAGKGNGGAAVPSPTTSSPSSSSGARLSTQFLSTPLFTVVRTSANGAGVAAFTAPQNLGTFILRAYVVSKGVARLGSNETSLVVRRPLSLTASLPRIVRVGDNFLAGVLVTSPGLASDAPAFTITVTVKVPIGAPVSVNSASSTATATLSGSATQAEVRFNFTAQALGEASLEFTVTDASGASDALVAPVPVLPQQSPVFLATSFALRGPATTAGDNSSVDWAEGLALPQAAPGSGSLDLLAGVGYLPAVLAATGAVATQRANLKVATGSLDASTALALAQVAPLAALYAQPLDAAQLGNATDGLRALRQLTTSTFGLLPYPPSTWNYSPSRTDILLNLQSAWLVSSLRYPKAAAGSALRAEWDSLTNYAVPQWKEAAAVQIVGDALSARNPTFEGNKPQPYSDWLTLAWARLSLGVGWYVSLCGSPEAQRPSLCTYDENVRNDLALPRLMANAPNASLEAYLVTALALQASSEPMYNSFVSKAADALISSIRVQGRTAYLSAYPGARAPAPLDVQALALRFLTRLQRAGHAVLAQKLAAYLAAAGGGAGASDLAGILPPQSLSAWVVAAVSSSLAKYDVLAGSTTPNLSLLASVNATVVLKASFDKSTVGKPPATSSTPWDKLPSPPGTLTFNVTGSGEVSLSVGLSFVPLQPLPFPTYRGLWVTSAIQLLDPVTGTPTGPPLAQVPLGSVVAVTIQVTSPDELGAVTVQALTAGGLEPLDPSLTSGQGSAGASAGATCPLATWAGDAYGVYYPWWYWPICPSQEVTPRSVTWRYQRLMAGTQVLSYSAVAATEGVFALPSIKASADAQPEVMGSTAFSTFTVCSAGCTPVPLSGSEGGVPAAKACPKDCSGNGACNTGSGVCVCGSGWTGAACDVPASA